MLHVLSYERNTTRKINIEWVNILFFSPLLVQCIILSHQILFLTQWQELCISIKIGKESLCTSKDTPDEGLKPSEAGIAGKHTPQGQTTAKYKRVLSSFALCLTKYFELLRPHAVLFFSISCFNELLCVLLYTFVFPTLPIVKFYRSKAASEGSKTVAGDLAAAGRSPNSRWWASLSHTDRCIFLTLPIIHGNIAYATLCRLWRIRSNMCD